MFFRILKWVGVAVIAVALGVAGFVTFQVIAFDRSVAKVYDIPVPLVARSTRPERLARGEHLAESIGACKACHGADFAGGKPIEMGPVGFLVGSNITPAGRLADYSDGELARLIQHGVKRDGRTVRFMTVEDFQWLPDEDVAAIVSYLRTVPPVTKPDAETHIGVLGKVLDRLDKVPFDVARRIDHLHRPVVSAPAVTVAYGGFIARMCYGCHGGHLSGGPIPGAPANMAVPANITPDATGIQLYTFDDFSRLIDQGVKKNGGRLDPLMPIEALGKLDDIERHALWAFLRTVPPRPFGQR